MRKFTKRLFFITTLMVLFAANSFSQRVAVKTNLLQWATASPNVGAEFVFNRRISLDFDVTVNPFDFNKLKTRLVAVQPEVRYWFGRPMANHFLGLNAMMTQYSLRYDETRYYGDAFAVGISYGYVFVLGEHWNLETNLGVGWLHYRNKKWNMNDVEPKSPNNIKDVIAPVRLGVSLSYIIK